MTCYSPNFIGDVASSKSCNVSSQAITNQVDILKRDVGSLLGKNE